MAAPRPLRSAGWKSNVARIALGLTALGMAYMAGVQAWASSLGRSAVARAYGLAPWDGRIGGRYALSLATPEANKAQRDTASQIAIDALRKDGTAVDAVVALGMNSAITRDAASARGYFTYAETLSRREIQTQLWAIEDAVSRNDVRGALNHYDIALRRSVPAREILFPILGSALAEPEVRAALVKTFEASPRWGPAFLFNVAGKGSEPRATAELFFALQRAKIPVSEAAKAVLVDTLIGQKYVDTGWAFYAAMRPGVDRRRSRDPYFTADLVSRAAFDWQLLGQSGIFTAIERNGDGGVFSFSVPASGSGLLLRQMQLLPAGRYSLSGHGRGIAQSSTARPYWQISCQDGRELGRVLLPGPAEATAPFAGHLIVPTDCPIQYLSLIAKASETSTSIEGEIYDVQLAPAG